MMPASRTGEEVAGRVRRARKRNSETGMTMAADDATKRRVANGAGDQERRPLAARRFVRRRRRRRACACGPAPYTVHAARHISPVRVDTSELGEAADLAVFARGSELWKLLEQEANRPGSVIGFSAEPAFCKLSAYDQTDEWDRHNKFWMTSLKAVLDDKRYTFDRLLDSVPGRPLASTSSGVRCDMRGLLAKYNLEYRRPYPQHCNATALDSWRRMSKGDLDDERVRRFSTHPFHVSIVDFRGTALLHHGRERSVDWAAWRLSPSSMVVPLPAGGELSAVGGNDCFARKVVTINFPALCWLLRDDHSADEIELAWLCMPLVKRGKANRGSGGGWQKNRGSGGGWQERRGRW